MTLYSVKLFWCDHTDVTLVFCRILCDIRCTRCTIQHSDFFFRQCREHQLFFNGSGAVTPKLCTRNILWKVGHSKQNLAFIPFSYKTMNDNFYEAYE